MADGRARPLSADDDLGRWTSAVAEVVRGVTALGVAHREPNGGWGTRTGDPRVAALDRCQADHDEGPTVEATRGGERPVGDGALVRAAPRWPAFAPAAVAAGFGSVLAVPMVVADAPPAAVTFYASSPHAFDDPATRGVAGLVALEAASLLLGPSPAAALRRARSPRDLVALATGVVMERFALDDTAAFALLLRCAREGGDLVGLAAHVAASPRPTGDGGGTDVEDDHRRRGLAAKRDALATRRDLLAQARETRADEREGTADRRERAADRREADLDERETAVEDFARRAGLTTVDRLTRADQALVRSRATVERSGDEIARSRAALSRIRELHAREQEEVDRESLRSARHADDPTDSG